MSREVKIKLSISVFVCLNIIAVFFANRRPEMARFVDDLIQRNLSPMSAWRVDVASGLLGRYATIVGLDNRWEMFSNRPRIKWRYRFTAQRADGSSTVVPTPLQSERSFLQANFFDFRETKIQENLSTDSEGMESYARYLCHAFASQGEAEIQSITVELIYQEIRERSEADTAESPIVGLEISEALEQVSCD